MEVKFVGPKASSQSMQSSTNAQDAEQKMRASAQDKKRQGLTALQGCGKAAFSTEDKVPEEDFVLSQNGYGIYIYIYMCVWVMNRWSNIVV